MIVLTKDAAFGATSWTKSSMTTLSCPFSCTFSITANFTFKVKFNLICTIANEISHLIYLISPSRFIQMSHQSFAEFFLFAMLIQHVSELSMSITI